MTRFVIERAYYLGEYRLYYGGRQDGILSVANPISLTKVEENCVAPDEPMMRLQDEEVNQLMNELWVAGIRPSKALAEPQSFDHMNSQIKWLRETADHLMKKPPRE